MDISSIRSSTFSSLEPRSNQNSPTKPSPSGHTRAESRGESAPESRAMAQEREAQQRIIAAHRQVEDAERLAEDQELRIKSEFQAREFAESQREEEALQTLRSKYERTLEELKKAQFAELTKTRRDGEEELAKLKDYYLTTVYEVEKQGKAQFENNQRQSAQMLGYERKLSQTQLAEETSNHQKQMEQFRQLSEQQKSDASKAIHDEYEKLHSNLEQATERANQHFNEQYQSKLTERSRVLADLDNRTSQTIREIRHDTAQKLAAYSTRQDDPFYKMVNLNFEVRDEGDQYMIYAKVPEHEQKNISVTVKGNQIVISGYRRNEERLEPEPGHSQSTSSYQTFQETFPLPAPVEAKELSRRFEGDHLIVSLPKKKLELYQRYQAKNNGKTEKIRTEKPVFPENLPIGPKETSNNATSTEPTSSRKTRGSRTLG